MSWARLSPSWQAACGEAWTADRTGPLPIGASIADADKAVVARGLGKARRVNEHAFAVPQAPDLLPDPGLLFLLAALFEDDRTPTAKPSKPAAWRCWHGRSVDAWTPADWEEAGPGGRRGPSGSAGVPHGGAGLMPIVQISTLSIEKWMPENGVVPDEEHFTIHREKQPSALLDARGRWASLPTGWATI